MTADKAPSRRPLVCGIVFLTLACIGLLVGVIILAVNQNKSTDDKEPSKPPKPPVDDGPKLSLGEYRHAAVTSENHQCSKIGKDMLQAGGSAVDAAIAGLLCVGVVSPHYSGIGGGFLMTIYDKGVGDTEKVVRSLNARESAPQAANQNMYIDSDLSSRLGGSAVGIPGQIAGYKAAHEKYGKLLWKDLFAPAIQLAQSSEVSASLAKISKAEEESIRKSAGLSAQFLKDNRTYKAGEEIKQETLAETLKTIALNGPVAFYDGELSQSIVDDINDENGIFTLDDLKNYEPVWKDAVKAKMLRGELTAYGPPPPSSAIVIAFILNIIEGYNMDASTPPDLLYHRLAEAMKFAFAKRALLGDMDFAENITQWIDTLTSPEFAEEFRKKIDDNATLADIDSYEPAFDIQTDSGTSQLSVLAEDGSAVSVTSTVNLHFGSKVRGSRTGIIFNNEMDDFSTPGTVNFFGVPSSPQNYIAPGKRPMSSMSPLLLIDEEGIVRMNVGAAGGTRIITSIVQSVVNSLFLNMEVNKAVGRERIHHQLLPEELKYEEGMPKDIVEGLERRGHTLQMETPHRWFGASMAIVNQCNSWCKVVQCKELCIKATADWRSQEDLRMGPMPDGY